MTSAQLPVTLVPAEGVERIDGELVACSSRPWLRMVGAETVRGRWIRLRYRSSFFDDPVRPLLRIERAGPDPSFHALNGPVLGTAEAIVRIPDDMQSVWISPAARVGRFDFALDVVEHVSRAAFFTDALRREPAWALVAAGARLIGARPEAWQDLKFATAATSLDNYDAWHRRLSRPLDLDGFDRPRSDWRDAPHIHLIVALDGNDHRSIATTLQSLRIQAYPRWTVRALAGPQSGGELLAFYRAAMHDDPRFDELPPEATFADLELLPDDRIALLTPGDTMADYALAAVIEAIADQPAAAVVYGDEDAVAADGLLHSPKFKPDWSPAFQVASGYTGRLTCIRCADLARTGCLPKQFLHAERDILDQVITLGGQKVIHVRRVLYRRHCERGAPARAAPPLAAGATMPVRASGELWPTAAVVVPTRDHARHLQACIRGLKEKTDYPRLKVIVVDNGSRADDATALLAEIESTPQCMVLRAPGPFNYSALCNHGVARTDADVIVPLNNDVAMIDPGWLKALVAWARRADVGAVGAKLLYPSGRIQHAGVVLGSGGRAGHLYKGAAGKEPGYLHRLQVAHEVAAVTGACLAVERSKFEAIGGFDAVHLPVDLNDIDLCLRLAERGWRTIWTPQAVLYHVEGGSRQRSLHPAKLYGAERRYFVERWADVIRDDPYFHPALSLYSHRAALAQS